MKKLILRFINLIWLLSIIAYLLGILSRHIAPDVSWIPAFMGLVFPVLLAIQLLFALIWLIMRKWYFLISFALLLATYNPILDTFQLVGKPQEMNQPRGIKVMSYNVRLLDFFNWSGKQYAGDSILGDIIKEKPAILCMQEFMLEDDGSRYTLDRVKKDLSFVPYYHIEYNYHSYKRNHGMALFSKYPILKTGHIHFDETANMILFADIKIENQVIRIYNVHLQSIHIQADQDLSGINGTRAGRVFNKLKNAYIRRADQSRILKDHILESPYPVMVCGDFNDTPVSYTVHSVKGDLVDSFRESGRGFGASYQYLPWLRIDYILHDKQMKSYDFRTGGLSGSDHRPVICNISLRDSQN